MIDSIEGQADRSWLYAISLPVSYILEMQLEDILGSNCVYSQQNIVVPFLICSAVLLYPEIYSILEIFCVSFVDSLKMYFDQISHTI
jgi:hypothetical protein